MKRIIVIFALMLLGVSAAVADIARPDPAKTPKPKASKSIDMEMDIRLDPDAKEARLLIPKSKLKQLRAELDQMDDGTTAAVAGSSSRLSTIVSGAFISLAMVFAGIWFVRSGKAATRQAKGAVVTLLVLGIASAATYVHANAGPPFEARSITGKMFSPGMHMYGFGWGHVQLETTEEDRIRLIVPDPRDKPATEE